MGLEYNYMLAAKSLYIPDADIVLQSQRNYSTCLAVLSSPSLYTGTSVRSSASLVHTTASSANCYRNIIISVTVNNDLKYIIV